MHAGDRGIISHTWNFDTTSGGFCHAGPSLLAVLYHIISHFNTPLDWLEWVYQFKCSRVISIIYTACMLWASVHCFYTVLHVLYDRFILSLSRSMRMTTIGRISRWESSILGLFPGPCKRSEHGRQAHLDPSEVVRIVGLTHFWFTHPLRKSIK